MRVQGERARLTEVGWDTPLVHETSAERIPEPTGNTVVVAVSACGVCHRDLIDRDGRVNCRYAAGTPPTDPTFLQDLANIL